VRRTALQDKQEDKKKRILEILERWRNNPPIKTERSIKYNTEIRSIFSVLDPSGSNELTLAKLNHSISELFLENEITAIEESDFINMVKKSGKAIKNKGNSLTEGQFLIAVSHTDRTDEDFEKTPKKTPKKRSKSKGLEDEQDELEQPVKKKLRITTTHTSTKSSPTKKNKNHRKS